MVVAEAREAAVARFVVVAAVLAGAVVVAGVDLEAEETSTVAHELLLPERHRHIALS